LAAEIGDIKIVQMLMEKGANPKDTTKDCLSAHYLIKNTCYIPCEKKKKSAGFSSFVFPINFSKCGHFKF
jgi:hypothetical protein